MTSIQLTAHIGKPIPLGSTRTARGTNFAIYAREPIDATLLLRDPQNEHHIQKFVLQKKHRTGHVWHVEITPSVVEFAYLWRIGQKNEAFITNQCLDPYATLLQTPVGATCFNDRKIQYNPWAQVEGDDVFDWMDVQKPRIPMCDLILYEMHVRGFSKRIVDIDASSKTAGTFAAIIERIPYLKALGINAIQLLPVMEFNESEWSAIDANTGQQLCQYWGYSTVAFFSLMNRYAKDGSTASEAKNEFKTMVRELHRAHIEVILDVVYNHTAEMGHDFVGRGFYGMKQLAPMTYYLMKEEGKTFVNHSGCGNTVNSNNIIVQDMICDSLKMWAHEMGVDGFRFDLATILCRDTNGEAVEKPAVIERMTKDGSMRDVKLIAEPWDCGGLYQVGSFPHHGVWMEWNGKFRDCIRRFIKGENGTIGEFATRMCGSEDLYGAGRRPFHSVNFVCAHDGFSMRDVVSYNYKHNEANGEQNSDGEQHNNSWNCGTEGATNEEAIMQLRERQIVNFWVALLVAGGTPMISMGDEYGHSKGGNNNTWCQDGKISWLDWREARRNWNGLTSIFRTLVHLRRLSPMLCRRLFLSDADVSWHGARLSDPPWSSGYNLLTMWLKGGTSDIVVCFNSGSERREIQLPSISDGWLRIIDSGLTTSAKMRQVAHLQGGVSYSLRSFSTLVLLQNNSNGVCTERAIENAACKLWDHK